MKTGGKEKPQITISLLSTQPGSAPGMSPQPAEQQGGFGTAGCSAEGDSLCADLLEKNPGQSIAQTPAQRVSSL